MHTMMTQAAFPRPQAIHYMYEKLSLAYCGIYLARRVNAVSGAWYIKAAEKGHSDTQRNMGIMYEKGQGAFQDLPKAMSWYYKAPRKRSCLQQHCPAVFLWP